MKVEIELDEKELQATAISAVRDYIHDHQLVRNQARQAIYHIVAEATQDILKNKPEKLAAMVLAEIKEYLDERNGQ